jgi:DNA replication and repair protein RecF
MFLKNLKLTNFRNYPTLDFKFKNQITVLIGDNAQGKSNFLESIYFLSTTKSPKADKDEELIKQGESYLRVMGKVDETDLEIALQLVESSLRKRVKVNGIGKRVADYAANLAVVLFAPEDVNLVTGSPSLRRAHLDQTLSQIDREYKKALSGYENVVTRKNRVLKAINEDQARTDELTFWTDQQLILGTILSIKREEFFKFVNSVEKKFGAYKFEYLPNPISAERLKEYQGREIAATNSLVGPHRDDFLFTLEGKDLAKYGSRGEQRTAVLDLKLAEVAYIEATLGSRPIFLLDDIFSELDDAHREHVIELSKMQQTIIATVEFDHYLQKALKEAEWWSVNTGQIKHYKD